MTPDKNLKMVAGLNSLMAGILADLTPIEATARCPKCGGRLLASVMIVVHMPIKLKVWRDGQYKVRPLARAVETREDIDQTARNADEFEDDREELHCENPACDWWCNVGDVPIKEVAHR